LCDPLSITLAATAVMGAYGQYSAGKTQQAMYDYEAKQGQADARAEAKMAVVESERIRKQGKMAAAEASVGMAANGGDLASAGSLAINREIYRGAEEDAYFALIGGEDRSKRMLAQADLNKMKGKSAYQSGVFGALTTLGGAAAGWKQAGGATFLGAQKGVG
jgi:hypothetical protein